MTATEAARILSAQARKPRSDLFEHCRAIMWSAAALYRTTPAATRPEGTEGADVTLYASGVAL